MDLDTPTLIIWAAIVVIGIAVLLNIRKRLKTKGTFSFSFYELTKTFRFSFSYCLNSIWRHKKRFINLSIGFIFALGLIGTIFIWTETSPRLAIIEAMDNEIFELSIEAVEKTNARSLLAEVQTWLQTNEDIVETAEFVQNAIGLFGIEGKSEYYNWYNPPANDPIYISSSQEMFFLNSTFLARARKSFQLLNGTFDINIDSDGIVNVLVSKRLVNKLEDQLGMQLAVGSLFNLSLAMRKANPTFISEQRLGAWAPYQLPLVRVNGIFDRKVSNNSVIAPNYPVETLGDGIFLPKVTIPEAMYFNLSASYFLSRVFVRLASSKMADIGVFEVQDTIDGLKDRLRFEFWGIIIREHTDNLYQAIDSYLNTRVVVLFMLLPVVILSAFLILFSTNSAYQARKEEVEILKSRGSGTRQIIGVLATEIFLVTISSTVLGIILGFLLTYIIIQSSGFLNFQGFSISSFTNFSLEALKSLSSWLSISFICAIIFFLIGLRQVFNFMREGSGREKQKSKLDTFVSERFLDIGALIIALLGLIYLIQSGIVIKILMDPAFLGVFLFLTLLLWFGFAGYGARIFGNLFSSLEGIFKRLFSNRVILALKNLERRQGELVSIVMILTITVSIGVFSAVYAQTVQTNSTMQIDYLTGSDFKVLTDRTSLGYVKTLNRDQGIEKSTAIATGVATIAQDRIIGIMGIDTLVYDEICHWDASSTSNVEEDHTTILERLRVTPYGVIINELIARRLQLGVGDDLHLSAIQWDLQLSATLEIVGIMHSAPGIGLLTSYEIKLGAFRESFGAVLVNQHLLWNPGFGGINTSTVFLAKASTQDVSEMLSTVERVQELPMTRRVYSPVLTEQTLTSFLDKTGVSGILTVDLGIATIVGVLGLTFFLSFIVDERRQEYAIMRAVGSQRRHILLLILFESSTFVVFSFFAGSFIGILFSWLFTTISLSSITLAEPIIPYFIDFPIPLLSLSTFIFFISMLLGILFPALKASKTEIVTVLKNL